MYAILYGPAGDGVRRFFTPRGPATVPDPLFRMTETEARKFLALEQRIFEPVTGEFAEMIRLAEVVTLNGA
jgi:hypothetical protein